MFDTKCFRNLFLRSHQYLWIEVGCLSFNVFCQMFIYNVYLGTGLTSVVK